MRAYEPLLRAAFGVDADTVIETWTWDQWVAHKRFIDDVWLPALRGGARGG